ncbi:hypothetical protein JCM8097_003065 [Rhodosporidiobolus ruineniae]
MGVKATAANQAAKKAATSAAVSQLAPSEVTTAANEYPGLAVDASVLLYRHGFNTLPPLAVSTAVLSHLINLTRHFNVVLVTDVEEDELKIGKIKRRADSWALLAQVAKRLTELKLERRGGQGRRTGKKGAKGKGKAKGKPKQEDEKELAYEEEKLDEEVPDAGDGDGFGALESVFDPVLDAELAIDDGPLRTEHEQEDEEKPSAAEVLRAQWERVLEQLEGEEGRRRSGEGWPDITRIPSRSDADPLEDVLDVLSLFPQPRLIVVRSLGEADAQLRALGPFVRSAPSAMPSLDPRTTPPAPAPAPPALGPEPSTSTATSSPPPLIGTCYGAITPEAPLPKPLLPVPLHKLEDELVAAISRQPHLGSEEIAELSEYAAVQQAWETLDEIAERAVRACIERSLRSQRGTERDSVLRILSVDSDFLVGGTEPDETLLVGECTRLSSREVSLVQASAHEYVKQYKLELKRKYSVRVANPTLHLFFSALSDYAPFRPHEEAGNTVVEQALAQALHAYQNGGGQVGSVAELPAGVTALFELVDHGWAPGRLPGDEDLVERTRTLKKRGIVGQLVSYLAAPVIGNLVRSADEATQRSFASLGLDSPTLFKPSASAPDSPVLALFFVSPSTARNFAPLLRELVLSHFASSLADSLRHDLEQLAVVDPTSCSLEQLQLFYHHLQRGAGVVPTPSPPPGTTVRAWTSAARLAAEPPLSPARRRHLSQLLERAERSSALRAVDRRLPRKAPPVVCEPWEEDATEEQSAISFTTTRPSELAAYSPGEGRRSTRTFRRRTTVEQKKELVDFAFASPLFSSSFLSREEFDRRALGELGETDEPLEEWIWPSGTLAALEELRDRGLLERRLLFSGDFESVTLTSYLSKAGVPFADFGPDRERASLKVNPASTKVAGPVERLRLYLQHQVSVLARSEVGILTGGPFATRPAALTWLLSGAGTESKPWIPVKPTRLPSTLGYEWFSRLFAAFAAEASPSGGAARAELPTHGDAWGMLRRWGEDELSLGPKRKRKRTAGASGEKALKLVVQVGSELGLMSNSGLKRDECVKLIDTITHLQYSGNPAFSHMHFVRFLESKYPTLLPPEHQSLASSEPDHGSSSPTPSSASARTSSFSAYRSSSPAAATNDTHTRLPPFPPSDPRLPLHVRLAELLQGVDLSNGEAWATSRTWTAMLSMSNPPAKAALVRLAQLGLNCGAENSSEPFRGLKGVPSEVQEIRVGQVWIYLLLTDFAVPREREVNAGSLVLPIPATVWRQTFLEASKDEAEDYVKEYKGRYRTNPLNRLLEQARAGVQARTSFPRALALAKALGVVLGDDAAEEEISGAAPSGREEEEPSERGAEEGNELPSKRPKRGASKRVSAGAYED